MPEITDAYKDLTKWFADPPKGRETEYQRSLGMATQRRIMPRVQQTIANAQLRAPDPTATVEPGREILPGDETSQERNARLGGKARMRGAARKTRRGLRMIDAGNQEAGSAKVLEGREIALQTPEQRRAERDIQKAKNRALRGLPPRGVNPKTPEGQAKLAEMKKAGQPQKVHPDRADNIKIGKASGIDESEWMDSVDSTAAEFDRIMDAFEKREDVEIDAAEKQAELDANREQNVDLAKRWGLQPGTYEHALERDEKAFTNAFEPIDGEVPVTEPDKAYFDTWRTEILKPTRAAKIEDAAMWAYINERGIGSGENAEGDKDAARRLLKPKDWEEIYALTEEMMWYKYQEYLGAAREVPVTAGVTQQPQQPQSQAGGESADVVGRPAGDPIGYVIHKDTGEKKYFYTEEEGTNLYSLGHKITTY